MSTTTTSLSTQLYLARTEILNQIIEYAQQYLELENVELAKSSFLSFVVNILSTLTSNMFFYQTSVYKEFFLTKAQLPETIYNLAGFLGYEPETAQYSIANLLITIPLTFTDSSVSFSFANGTVDINNGRFFADQTEFRTYYTTEITVTNNSAVTIEVTQDQRVYSFPVSVDTTSSTPQFQFVLPVRQYKIVEQSFGIDDDLEMYQFTDIKVPITGKVSTMEVYVIPPGIDYDSLTEDQKTIYEYTEEDSLYLMDAHDKNYVSRPTDGGVTLYFGNGLLGNQPEAGSKVKVKIYETEGEDGNVMVGAINKGDRVYTEEGGLTKIVNYTVTNPSPAYNGSDGESLTEIRNNAIANLTALNRLVSESDYENANTIMSDAPLASKALPVLKRSDIRNSEIQLFTTLDFGGEVVPTSNVSHTVASGTTYVAKGTVITADSLDYYTLFDISIDSINSVAYYTYILEDLIQTPTLNTNPDDTDVLNLITYNMYLDSVEVSSSDSTALFDITYYSQETDFSSVDCTMVIVSTSDEYEFTNVPGSGGGHFTLGIDPYTELPEGELTCKLRLTKGTDFISEYSTTFTFRRNLDAFMMSNVVDATSNLIIYDIPVVEKTYFDGITTRDFELQVLQEIMSNMDFSSYRMLTDFANLKFCKTKGTMSNMQYNAVTKTAVIDIVDSLPVAPSVGDRYIVSCKGGVVKNNIAVCTSAVAPVTWSYTQPSVDDFVYVTNDAQNYIYTGHEWLVPSYDIPLQIVVEIFRTSATIGETEITNDIKDAIIDAFSTRFGPHATIFKSEIIDTVQGVTGVEHCHLVEPESNIFFDTIDIDTFTTNQLLVYTPEYVYFTEDDITVRVIE